MSYTIVDLLKKLEALEENAFSMYKELASLEEGYDIKLRTVARILASEEERHIALYRKLIGQAEKEPETTIDFSIYDKASSLVDSFKKRIVKPKVKSVKELVQFSVEFERENVALLIDIRGRMVRKEEDSVTFNYLTLTELIMEEQKHVETLNVFLT